MADISEQSADQTLISPSDRGHRLFKQLFVLFFALFLLGTLYWIGYENGRSADALNNQGMVSPEDALIINKKNQNTIIDFSLFWKVWDVLNDKYVDKNKLDARKLFYGAIDGMLAATGDPYTTFFSPEESQEFNEDISGKFEGIGAEMGMQDGVITIIAPLEGMPAEKAGLLSGDKVIKIDGVISSGYSLDEAVKKIRGPKGSEVKLTIFRVGEEETRDIVIQRGVILVKSVRFEMKEEDIAFIRVSRFGDDTEAGFKDAANQVLKQKAKGLIIDLRNNPGGFLETAIAMASLLLPAEKVVVMEEDGQGQRVELRARRGDILSTVPTVILINEGSASASEILAGALRDNRDNVVLVGKKTFGKGSVQELVSVGKNLSVKVTVARWLTPAGNQINDTGISPDREVALSTDDRNNKIDPQMDRALEEVRTLIHR